MKIHESVFKILESHIWTGKKGELWKFDIFHENSWKRMNNTWISHLNREKGELWTFDIFTWKFMKAHEKYLNPICELRKEPTLKVLYFFMKIHESTWQILESHIWTCKRVNFESLIFFMKIYESAWIILESHIWTCKRVNFESLIFFMKIHESAWIIVESHIW
jgi:hypothetical protein